jgi:Flp pilus assembly protein TadG
MLRTLRSWFRNDGGVVAIEFAMLALPFFVLLFGIVETSFMFASSIVLEGGTAEAGRLIRTGQAQDTADPEATFRDELCDQVSDIIPCASVQYEVISIPNGTFADTEDYEPQYDSDGNFMPQGFSAGDSNDVVLIRAVYRYEFLIPYLGTLINRGHGNAVNLMSVTVIKNEPYEFGS